MHRYILSWPVTICTIGSITPQLSKIGKHGSSQAPCCQAARCLTSSLSRAAAYIRKGEEGVFISAFPVMTREHPASFLIRDSLDGPGPREASCLAGGIPLVGWG